MKLLDYYHNRRSVPGFLANSMPKAGTHLLMKAVSQFPGIHHIKKRDVTNRLRDHMPAHSSDAECALIGVDWPQPIPLSFLRQHLKKARRGGYYLAHTQYASELADLLAELNIKMLLILRDPRAVVASHAKYVAKKPQHYLFDTYQPLSPDARLMISIRGLETETPQGYSLRDIRTRYASLMTWTDHPLNYTTYFEKLVGPQGGGSRSEQLQELKNIADHLGVRYTSSQLERIAENLFGGTTTFRKGTIGGWQDAFEDQHTAAFKQIAGDILIELGYEQDLDW